MNYGSLGTKILTLVLIVAIVVPATFAVLPQKEAQASSASCVAVMAATIVASLITDVASAIISVPAYTGGKTYSSDIQAGQSEEQYITDCIEHEVALAAGKYLLTMMTNDLVKWINSGFQGGFGQGGFANNPGAFFQGLGDQIANEFMSGANLGGLCSAFQANVKNALQIQLPSIEGSLPYGSLGLTSGGAGGGTSGSYGTSQVFQTQSKCTLNTGIMTNFINDFASVSNPWGTWITATQDIDNNPIGAYLDAEDDLQTTVSEAQGLELNKLNWGNGFFSASTCNGSTCTVNTPGHTIASQLDSQLGVPATQLGLADDLDKIFNALEGQLFAAIFQGAGGLGGSSGSANDNKALAAQVATSQALANQAASQGSSDANSELDTASQTNTTPAGTPQSSAQNISETSGVVASASCPTAGHPATEVTNGDKTDETPSFDGSGESTYNGLIAGDSSGGGCTTGSTNPEAWIKLDLGTTVTLGEIRVYERSGAPAIPDPNVKFHVAVADKNGNIVWSSPSVLQDFSTNPFRYQVADGTMPPKTAGEYVEILADTAGKLEIAEIEVYPAVGPGITLKGGTSVTLDAGQPYTESNYGYTASDAFGDDITSDVTETPTSIDTSTAGTYTITYSVTDKDGLTATAKRSVIVNDFNSAD